MIIFGLILFGAAVLLALCVARMLWAAVLVVAYMCELVLLLAGLVLVGLAMAVERLWVWAKQPKYRDNVVTFRKRR